VIKCNNVNLGTGVIYRIIKISSGKNRKFRYDPMIDGYKRRGGTAERFSREEEVGGATKDIIYICKIRKIGIINREIKNNKQSREKQGEKKNCGDYKYKRIFSENNDKGRGGRLLMERREKYGKEQLKLAGDVEINPGPDWDTPEIERQEVKQINIVKRTRK